MGLNVAVAPVAGLTVAARLTVPAKLRLPTVMVEVPDLPALIVSEVGLAEMVKSTTFTVTLTE